MIRHLTNCIIIIIIIIAPAVDDNTTQGSSALQTYRTGLRHCGWN